MLTGADVELNTVFDIDKHYDIANKIIYCGSIDTLFDSSLGELPYRGVQFIQKHNETVCGIHSLTTPVMNFTDIDIPYTRVINHKLFLNASKYNTNTILTYEYPNNDALKAYPILTDTNICLYNQYKHLLNKVYPKIIPGGRLGLYKYIDMDDTIELAFNLVQQVLT
jgi:UDP-galactopyranose mutase